MIDIRNGDCLQLLRELESGSVDLTVTSPPYDNLRTYNGNIAQWSFEKFQQIASELYRVTKTGGVVVWIVADATVNGSETGTSFRQALHFMECGFNLHDTMIWEKDTFSFPDKTRYRHCFEYMFVLSKGKPKSIHQITDKPNKYAGHDVHGTSRNPDGAIFRKSNDKKQIIQEHGVRYNVWQQPTEKQNRYGHPAVFPEQLARDHVISWSSEGETVLDPFMGSGTTAVACIKEKRGFIGFEIDKAYFQIAKGRIESAQQAEIGTKPACEQISLFEEA